MYSGSSSPKGKIWMPVESINPMMYAYNKPRPIADTLIDTECVENG